MIPKNALITLIIAPIRLLIPSRHLRALGQLLVLCRPNSTPVPQILQNALRPPRPHPQPSDRKTTPENDLCRKAEPEHDRAEQHIEDLEREEDDEQQQGYCCQVGLLCHSCDEGRGVGFNDAGVGEEG